jgi:ABC-type multidrug transport system fused ATPase/permease subunit
MHAELAIVSADEAGREYVLQRYDQAIRYYWTASRNNKRWYKWTRHLTVILGATVTLLASLSSSELVTGAWRVVVGIAAPVIAAALTISSGLLSAFQWGAAWQEMVLTAERLEQERDRIRVTPASDPARDLEILNKLVLTESAGFFTRIMGNAQRTALEGQPDPGSG